MCLQAERRGQQMAERAAAKERKAERERVHKAAEARRKPAQVPPLPPFLHFWSHVCLARLHLCTHCARDNVGVPILSCPTVCIDFQVDPSA